MLAGIELAVCEINAAGGVAGSLIELLVRDTAANPQTALTAVDELACQGVVALVGEYPCVVARVIATKADTLGLPFLCSSAVLNMLTEKPTQFVARLAPAQTKGWQIYADFLLANGHINIALAIQSSVYLASGARILEDYYAVRGGNVVQLDAGVLSPESICDQLADNHATALLLLVGFPDPAVSIVKSIRHDKRLTSMSIGAPAGQPEFTEWAKLLGNDGTAIPFLRYMPQQLSAFGLRVQALLRDLLGVAPSFVAFEGYDAITVLAEALRLHGADRAQAIEPPRGGS